MVTGMGVADVDRSAVLAALAEFDEVGRHEFLRRYGFGPARQYELVHDGRRYDSKAIIGAAHGYAAGSPLAAQAFTGGEQSVARRLRQLGFTVERNEPSRESPRMPDHDASVEQHRSPLVLIAPSYGSKAARQRWADTLASPVAFTDARLRDTLTAEDLATLLALHPDGTARFWGAVASHNTKMDRLRQGDIVLFTGLNRVQGIAALGCKLRNKPMADLLWPPQSGSEGWINVYTVIGFQKIDDIDYPQLRALIGSSDRDIFQSTRALTAAKSASVIAGLGLSVTPDEAIQDQRAETALLAALYGRSEVVAAEANRTAATTYELPARTVTVHRAEAALVNTYRQSIAGLGNHRIRSTVGFTDLYLTDDGDIIEAKRAAEHRYVRDALGQLLDYALNTHEPVNRLTALFPVAPAAADVRLLHNYGVDCLHWDRETTFIRLPAPEHNRELMRPLWARYSSEN
jgi:hypothetical protein